MLIAGAIAGANWAFWAWTNRPVVSPGWEGRIGGFAYSGYQRDQSPMAESFPSEQDLAADMGILSQYTNRIRTYSSIDYDSLPMIAGEAGLKVAAGAWLTGHKDRNNLEIRALIEAQKNHPNIERAIVGNEAILRGDLTVKELIRYIEIVRKRVRVPVSTAEPWNIWLKYPELAKHVDFITVHLLPYWEGVPRKGAVQQTLRHYEEVQRAFPRMKIVIGEIGWPSGGDRVKFEDESESKTPAPTTFSTATIADQAQFLREFLPVAKARQLDYYLMEAFDQPWKVSNEGRTGAYWGMFNAAREPKFSLEGPVITDPDWPHKALVASAIGVLPILWFCYAFRRFRFGGKLFFGVLIQSAVTLVVWLVTLPFEFYLNTLDWLMFIVLLPALAAMLMILLTNGFEFTEVVWSRWLRHFEPRDSSAQADESLPFVSIHLPCHNEPPEMVIQTLASLARLDYPNFEILVIDNNTKKDEVWKPVERYIASHFPEPSADSESGAVKAPRVRFFHLADWPGFKAGALNFALTETDPRATVVGVVDSDYVVRTDWLRVMIPHFEPGVAVVQAPQAHRNWQTNRFQRMTSWEYDGFFRIGMHHRNERDAIIQHGTMTLVDREALVSTGGWSEWCICEDAELGLRLMNAGWETRYIDEVLGRGLTPSNFSGYKSQRFRWAFGAMQILKRRWNWLWGRQDRATKDWPGLTAGQRFHFLTGWFSWFADALHLVFTLASLVWTIGMIADPENFSLPLDLFVIPVLGFFVLKAFFGPALYRARVRCGWGDVVGASIASMALSHAIALGIITGLIQKKGTFVVTPKSWKAGGRAAWFGPVREEVLLMAALLIGVLGTLYSKPMQYETWLWTAILATQSIPYVSALTCALISAYAPRLKSAGSADTSGNTVALHAVGSAGLAPAQQSSVALRPAAVSRSSNIIEPVDGIQPSGRLSQDRS